MELHHIEHLANVVVDMQQTDGAVFLLDLVNNGEQLTDSGGIDELDHLQVEQKEFVTGPEFIENRSQHRELLAVQAHPAC